MKSRWIAAIGIVGLASTSLLASQNGHSLFKKKCAACHGSKGEGKASVKAPSLTQTTLDASQIAEHLTKGEPNSKAPHNKSISGLSEAQAKMIADYVKTLK